jgi:hypothetical protein
MSRWLLWRGLSTDHPEPVPVTFRMADFANFALKVGELWGRREEVSQAFAKLEGAQAELALDKDPIHQVLEIWLADKANHSRKLDAGTLHKTFKSVVVAHNIEWRFENGKAFAPKQPEPENPSLIRPAEPEEVPELAGFAGIERG